MSCHDGTISFYLFVQVMHGQCPDHYKETYTADEIKASFIKMDIEISVTGDTELFIVYVTLCI